MPTEGQTATGPNGQRAVFSGGRWVVQGGGMPANPKYPYEGDKAAAELDKARNDAAISGVDARNAPRLTDAQVRKDEADAAKAAAEAAAKEAEQQRIAQGQANKRLQEIAASDNVLSAVQAARIMVQKGGTTGWGSYAAYLPDNDARDLAGYLSTIKSNLTFDRLQQMRDNSPTGGAVGSASDKDMDLLGSTVANLDQGASKEKILDGLNRIEQHYQRFQAYRAGVDPDSDSGKKMMTAAFGSAAQGNDGPGGGEQEYKLGIDEQFATDHDKRFAAAAQAAFDKGANFDQLQAMADTYGYRDWDPEMLKTAIEYRDKGGKGATFQAPESGYTNPSVIQRGMQEVGEGPVGAYFGDAANALTFGTMDELQGIAKGDSIGDAFSGRGVNTNEANFVKGLVREANPTASTLGNLSGGIIGALTTGALAGAGRTAATALAPRALAGDALFGAAYGAGESNDGRLSGAALGSVAGAGGGALGRGAVNGLGTVIGGVRGPAQYLSEQGIRLTPGQIGESMGGLGRMLKRREDRLAGFSGIGDAIGRQQERGIVDFNRAAFRQGMEPIREIPPGIAEEGIQQAEGMVSDAYGRALDGRSFAPDLQSAQSLAAAQQRGAQALGELNGEFDNTLATRVMPFMEQPNISGRDVQAMLQGLRKDASALGNKPRADIYRDASGQAEDAITGMVGRQAPDMMPAFNDANRAYGNLQILKDAVAKGLNTEGRFTPAQLGTAARTNAKKYGGTHASTERPFYDLQRAGQQILPSKIPDSGTAGRQAAGDGLMGIAQAGLRNLRLPIYSDPAIDLLNAVALYRPQYARDAGELVQRGARFGGLFGAPAMAYAAN